MLCCSNWMTQTGSEWLDALVLWVTESASVKLTFQTGSGAHPASCTVGTGGPFPGAKARPERDADHSPPSSAEDNNE
jgi:hypothetical protein